MASINKDYISRLYAVHDRIVVELGSLVGDIQEGAAFDKPEYFNHLGQLTNELEKIFAEVLSEAERKEIQMRGVGVVFPSSLDAEAGDADKIEKLLDDLAGDDD